MTSPDLQAAALFAPLTLPNGAVIPNRLAKAAMEENLCDPDHAPGPELIRLYQRWGEGGAGLIITGNVMVDARALTGPGGVVLEDDRHLDRFRAWATAGRSGGGQLWMQINHPGRQVFATMGQPAVAPSAVAVDIPGYASLFAQPRAMEEADIAELIQRFASTAALAEKAGFTGVEIHAAHGYLLSQFLSPLTNRRTDRWGGSLENRARLLLEVVQAMRATVSPGFCVAVKLNSADFQKGGFDASDAARVVGWLNERPVDLVELSGGSYESPAMQGNAKDGSTGRREAYFIDFARDIARTARMPVMVTGGIRRRDVAAEALAIQGALPGVALLGIARAMAIVPELPRLWQQGQRTEVELPAIGWKNRVLASLAVMSVTKRQIRRLAAGRSADVALSPLISLILDRLRISRLTRAYRRWIVQRPVR
jgi:2,4-dienoyl-CoA reductase-like NADH-dependent reductase (Old Yellow Enzyme family)